MLANGGCGDTLNSGASDRRTRQHGRLLLAVAALGCLAMPGLAAAQTQTMPDTENGRYTLAPVADGVLRLDTRTGVMSTCNNKRIGWACYAMPDERAALDAEIGRLQKDNVALQARLAQQDSATAKTEEALPKGEALPKEDSLRKDAPKAAESQRKLELILPSDRDIDRAMNFLERAWRRLVEMADRMQKDVAGKI